jgi:hypothetical protein
MCMYADTQDPESPIVLGNTGNYYLFPIIAFIITEGNNNVPHKLLLILQNFFCRRAIFFFSFHAPPTKLTDFHFLIF